MHALLDKPNFQDRLYIVMLTQALVLWSSREFQGLPSLNISNCNIIIQCVYMMLCCFCTPITPFCEISQIKTLYQHLLPKFCLLLAQFWTFSWQVHLLLPYFFCKSCDFLFCQGKSWFPLFGNITTSYRIILSCMIHLIYAVQPN